MTADALKRWFVDSGAPLARAQIISLHLASNGYSVEKHLVPKKESAKTEFLRVLLSETKLSEQEYAESLQAPVLKRTRTSANAANVIASSEASLTATIPGSVAPAMRFFADRELDARAYPTGSLV